MGIKSRLMELGDLPYSGMNITVRDGSLSAENCAAVVGCTDSHEKTGEIVLRLRNGRLVRVCGEGLTLESMGGDGVFICGRISSVTFIEL